MSTTNSPQDQWPSVRCKCGFVGPVDPTTIYMGVYEFDEDQEEQEMVPCPECGTRTPMDSDAL